MDASTRIELEEYDNGGQGVAYYDTTPGNTLEDNTYRTDEDVDANETLVTNDVRNGEWLEYTTDIQAGVYHISLGKSWSGESDGVKLFIADSNSATEFTELGEFILGGGVEALTLENVDLSNWAGTDRVIRIEIVGDYMGIDYLDFVNFNNAPTQTAYVVRTISAETTTRVELEEYDVGGQGVAYNDTSPGNNASDFRSDESVDSNGQILTNDVLNGEWLEYTTEIQSGLYDVTIKKAWGGGDSGVKLLIADASQPTNFTELGLFDFGDGSEEFFTLQDIDLGPWAGLDRVLRIEIMGNYMGIDYLDFIPAV